MQEITRDDITNSLLDIIVEERAADLTHFAFVRYADTIRSLGGHGDGIVIRMDNGQEFVLEVVERFS